MLVAFLAGVWAASTPAAITQRWVPETPAYTEHYFLVVSKTAGGTLRAFIRNPEANDGARIGTGALDVSNATVSLHGRRGDIGGSLNTDGTLTLRNVGGQTLRFHRATTGDLLWYDPLPSTSWRYREPARLSDGWRVATLREAGMRAAPIAQVMDGIAALRTPTLISPYIQSVAIARHGKLVVDQYFYGFTADTPHDVRSAGKSVTTLMVGAAIADTHDVSPASHVLDLLPQYVPLKNDDPRKRSLSVENLMTMSSGLACDDNDDDSPGNEDTMQSQPAGTDWYRYTLELPTVADPGTKSVYCTAGINLLGAIVQNAVHVPLDRYFAERFAKPMDFGSYGMWLMPPPANAAYMGGGDRFRPRDFLKFGVLLLENGRWNGRQIVPAEWIAASVVPRTAPEGEGDHYGYGWHLSQVPVDGANYDVISAGGNGGQLMIAVPSLDLAVMVTAGNYGQFPVWRQFLPEVVTAAVRACR